jgi:N-acetylglutamate synthase-like GNAT family acetyltransferase
MDAAIRDAEPRDAEAITRLLGELGYPASAEAVAARLARLTADDRVVVAECDGEVVGLAGLHYNQPLEYDRPAARISALVVTEHRRGRGIGRALAAELEADARRRDSSVLYLTSAERRTDAHAFYRALGFEETGHRFAKLLINA